MGRLPQENRELDVLLHCFARVLNRLDPLDRINMDWDPRGVSVCSLCECNITVCMITELRRILSCNERDPVECPEVGSNEGSIMMSGDPLQDPKSQRACIPSQT